jgi:hypothetical protein
MIMLMSDKSDAAKASERAKWTDILAPLEHQHGTSQDPEGTPPHPVKKKITRRDPLRKDSDFDVGV